jgi:hypothetical protein
LSFCWRDDLAHGHSGKAFRITLEENNAVEEGTFCLYPLTAAATGVHTSER